MTRWTLLEQQPDRTFADTGDQVEADTWGRACELLLAFELCNAPRRYFALSLDVLLGMERPVDQQFSCNSGVYKVVPAAGGDLAHVAALVKQELRETLARLTDDGAVGS